MRPALFILFICINLSREETITEHCYNAYHITEEDDTFYQLGFGVAAQLKEFPHLVAIGWSGDDNSTFWGCGGSLVTTKFVLSAAHCAYRSQNGKSVSPDVARMGTIDLEDYQNDKEEFTQQFRIAKIIVHPQYKSSQRYFDIALMELDGEAKVTEVVAPICLWNSQREVFTTLQASGFGETVYGGGTSPTLQKVRVTRTSYNECKKLYSPAVRPDRKLPDGLFQYQHMCASDKTGKGEDTCQGDSGGPLEFKMTTKIRDQWINVPVLVGVTSFGEAGCGNSAPAVYTRVASFIPWIKNETKQSINLEACTKLYSNQRHNITSPFLLDRESPSKVLIISFYGICPGIIIHESFVLAVSECARFSSAGYIRTSDGQEIGIDKDFNKNGLALIKLKRKINYWYTKLSEYPIPYIYEVGPSCLEPEPKLDLPRFLDATFQNTIVQMRNKQLYNVSDCLEYLGERTPVDESSYECLSGEWLAPKDCDVKHHSFSFYEKKFDEGFGVIPVVRSYVVNDDNCGSILMKKITKSDIDWINSMIF